LGGRHTLRLLLRNSPFVALVFILVAGDGGVLLAPAAVRLVLLGLPAADGHGGREELVVVVAQEAREVLDAVLCIGSAGQRRHIIKINRRVS